MTGQVTEDRVPSGAESETTEDRVTAGAETTEDWVTAGAETTEDWVTAGAETTEDRVTAGAETTEDRVDRVTAEAVGQSTSSVDRAAYPHAACLCGLDFLS